MNFKAGTIGILTSALISTSALAADMQYPPPPPPPPVVVSPPYYVLSWTGFYIGANAGYGWANVSSDTLGSGSDDLAGFIGGGQLGYNWQAGNFLFGFEGDFQGSAQHSSNTLTILGVTGNIEQKIPWFATLRGRLGYASGPWLIYLTGGAAWANYELSASALGVSVSDNVTKTAWTVGGGVEWMFVSNWSAKLEYLFVDTGDRDVTLFGTTISARAQDNIVRAGINYHY
jgi:outer membrane immunogenic protein